MSDTTNPSGRNSVTPYWHHGQAINVMEQTMPKVAHFFAEGSDAWFHTHNGVIELLNLLEDAGFALVRKSERGRADDYRTKQEVSS